VILSSVPLLTFFFALAHRLEPFRWRALVGAVIAIGGIAILINAEFTLALPAGSLLAALGAAVCGAEAGVVIKQFPPSHPVATNGLAMAIGAVLLVAISVTSGEEWALPNRTLVWSVLAYLVLLGSLALFALYLFVLKRWTASGASYQFVLIPIVATLLGAWLVDEPITSAVVLGGAVIILGVYVGALSHGKKVAAPASRDQEVLAQRCSTT
jgi:drug/metabolite transporter (DMT)-like permease